MLELPLEIQLQVVPEASLNGFLLAQVPPARTFEWLSGLVQDSKITTMFDAGSLVSKVKGSEYHKHKLHNLALARL